LTMRILFYGGTKIEQCEFTGRCWVFNRWVASLKAAEVPFSVITQWHGKTPQDQALEVEFNDIGEGYIYEENHVHE
jgi:hypothetical protein